MKKYKIFRRPLDETRKQYIRKIVENLEKHKFAPDIVNLMQSFTYLILNDDFHKNVRNIRKSLKIPIDGFPDDTQYKKWKTNTKLRRLENKIKQFVIKNNLSYKQHEPLVIKAIWHYVLIKDFEPQNMIALTDKRFSYHGFIGGWDVPDPVFGKNNTSEFDKVFWEVDIYPTDNLTQSRNALRHYYAWMTYYHFKDGFDRRLFDLKNRDVIKNWNPRIKKPINLSLTKQANKSRIALKYQSYLNTKTKDILREFDKHRGRIRILQKELKSGQVDKRELTFEKKIKHYLQYLEGLSPAKAEWENRKNKKPEERRDLHFKTKIREIKTHYNDVRKNVNRAFKIRLSL